MKSLGRGWIYIQVEEGLVKDLKKKIKEKRTSGHLFALNSMIEKKKKTCKRDKCDARIGKGAAKLRMC